MTVEDAASQAENEKKPKQSIASSAPAANGNGELPSDDEGEEEEEEDDSGEEEEEEKGNEGAAETKLMHPNLKRLVTIYNMKYHGPVSVEKATHAFSSSFSESKLVKKFASIAEARRFTEVSFG